MEDNRKMKWQKDWETFFSIYNSFILEGFVDDDQPYEDWDGKIKYCRLYEYFDKVYSNHADPLKRKRVIIYDPTESEEKRFHICDENYSREAVEPTADEPVDETKYKLNYTNSAMSQHFWDITHDEDLDKLLIDHKAAGASLDFSRIHYAITENSERIKRFELSEKFRQFLHNVVHATPENPEPSGYLFVIKMTSRLLSRDGDSNGLNEDELMLFRQLLNIVQSLDTDTNETVSRYNHKLVILANKIEDLPKWFANETVNPFVKIINVSKPSEENKLDFFQDMLDEGRCFTEQFLIKYNEIETATQEAANSTVQTENGANETAKKRNSVKKKFLAYTNDFSMKMLRRYKTYLEANPLDDPTKLGFSVNTFRLGDMTNPWDDPQRIKEMLNIKETVSKKIKGQDHALTTAQSILTNAAIGLDRAENPNAPRVVLFLAGPTGTGKTELCKQLAETIFGSEERIVRFDMSEYGQEESDQKLFGAPPGYIGYEEGGKLTNAIKKEPFSLVLFDEIEKAHNSILDKFLQILGDGRLTDGKGDTVRFTDCIIVITSNAGVVRVRKPNGEPMTGEEMSDRMDGEFPPEEAMDIKKVTELEEAGKTADEIYEKVKEHLRYNVKAYFNCQLGRPELYGRIENSIVYYNYIGRESVTAIVNSKIKEVTGSAVDSMELARIECGDDVVAAISRFCQQSNVRALGARGIIKSTGKLFTSSLSNLFSPYIRGENGMDRSDLKNRVLTCHCEGEVSKPDDIVWSIV